MTEVLTQEFRKRIREKIEVLEKSTSLEFVPVFLSRSSRYLQIRIIYALIVALLELAAIQPIVAREGAWREWPSWLSVAISVAFGIVAFGLVSIRPVLRWALPSWIKKIEVEKAAHDAFLRYEIFGTRARTGILILVSQLERSVYILADRGLNAHIQHDEWARLAAKLAKDFGHQSAGATFLEALEEMATRVSVHFPASPENPNELSDEVRSD